MRGLHDTLKMQNLYGNLRQKTRFNGRNNNDSLKAHCKQLE